MKKILSVATLLTFAVTCSANALQFSDGRNSVKINASGTAGVFEPKFKDSLFLGDFDLRAQYNYAIARGQTLGFVYDWDAEALDNRDYSHDLFALWENRNIGRIEIGLTESAANKLGVGLPDVGGLRVNHIPLFYKKIAPKGNVIPDTTVTSGHDAPRINLVSVPTGFGQYGLSAAAFGDEYDYAVDGGVKFRFPNGKLKSALSLGASFMDKPHNYSSTTYTPNITADWRAQGSIGFNLQYNSWIWGTSVLGIYDKNPIGTAGDGISAGTGISYDILNYSLSLSYMYSHTGIWHNDMENYYNHNVITSFRYKYNENLEVWTSIGLTTETPYLSTALKLTF